MKSVASALLLLALCVDGVAQTLPSAADAAKLSRRERKERIAKLSEQYRQFLIDVEPIIQPSELDTFLILESDAQRDLYINDFWRRHDLTEGVPAGAFKNMYYERIAEAKERYRSLASDRGRDPRAFTESPPKSRYPTVASSFSRWSSGRTAT